MKIQKLLLLAILAVTTNVVIQAVCPLTRNEQIATAATAAAVAVPFFDVTKKFANKLGVCPQMPGVIAAYLLASHFLKKHNVADISGANAALLPLVLASNDHLRALTIFKGAPTARIGIATAVAQALLKPRVQACLAQLKAQ